ncbi:MAG: 4Fe-4S binding protein [Bacteroidales bacterium]|nr:4Fe-4S binding protein [Bacteroidales bacterium]
MAYVISDACVSCGTCAAECPNEAINEGAEHFEIDPSKCVDCGSCASVCPTEAISAGE